MKRKIATVTLDLSEDGVENIEVNAVDAESRELALQRLLRCLPQLELLESALQEPPSETATK